MSDASCSVRPELASRREVKAGRDWSEKGFYPGDDACPASEMSGRPPDVSLHFPHHRQFLVMQYLPVQAARRDGQLRSRNSPFVAWSYLLEAMRRLRVAWTSYPGMTTTSVEIAERSLVL